MVDYKRLSKEVFDVEIDGMNVNPIFQINNYFNCTDTKLKNYFKSAVNKSSLSIKIKKEDIKNSFLSIDELRLEDVEFEPKIGTKNVWMFPRKYWENNFIPLKTVQKWNVLIDDFPTTVDFQIAKIEMFINPIKNPELNNYLREKYDKNPEDKINIKISVNPEDLEDIINEEYLDNNSQLINNFEFVEYNFDISNSNYKIVPVGANWTENRNIVGYYNLITEEYQSTPAYDLINQSKDNLGDPHFLILDEMNLSHVERYFADFLSAIESGENIPLYGIDDDLEIPNNLFIIGTVNVDETTYMFSPKVLDRANVLEFETYSSKDYMKGNINLNAPEGNIGYLENPLIDSNIRNLGINELKEAFNGVKVQNKEFWDLLSDEIFKFQTILKKSGFDFGFRVINEIVRFMLVAWRYEGEPTEWTNWERYFDAQIKQKLLPKLHGSEKILGDTLQDLAKACEDEEGIKYYTSAKKLNEMIKVLDKQRYVSFIN